MTYFDAAEKPAGTASLITGPVSVSNTYTDPALIPSALRYPQAERRLTVTLTGGKSRRDANVRTTAAYNRNNRALRLRAERVDVQRARILNLGCIAMHRPPSIYTEPVLFFRRCKHDRSALNPTASHRKSSLVKYRISICIRRNISTE